MATMCVYKAPANFIIPNLPTKFPFGLRYENTGKIPKGSYRNTKSVYNSRKIMAGFTSRFGSAAVSSFVWGTDVRLRQCRIDSF